MSEKDIAEKTLESYNDVFADISNVFLFNGKHVIQEDELEDAQPRSYYKADGRIREQERDVSKYWRGNMMSATRSLHWYSTLTTKNTGTNPCI